jgi:S1-C subfamily serine protease
MTVFSRSSICLSALLLTLASTLSAYAQPPVPRGGPIDIERRIVVSDDEGARLGLLARDTTGTASAGVTVTQLTGGSPAEKAGLRRGDVITSYDGEKVRSVRQFTRLVRESVPGRAVPVLVQRDGKVQTLSVTPEAGGDDDGPRSRPQSPSAGDVEIEIERRRPRAPRPSGMGEMPPMLELRGMPEMHEMHGMPMDMRMGSRPMRETPPRLGLTLDPLSPQLRTYFAAPAGGALVITVDHDSLAAQAGVRAGDVVVSINGLAVRDAEDVVEGVREAGPDGTVALGLVRDRKPLTVSVSLRRP